MVKLLSILSLINISIPVGLGTVVTNNNTFDATNNLFLKRNVNLDTTVSASIKGFGIQSEGVASNLLENFVFAVQNKIHEIGATSWNFKELKLSLTTTALSTPNNQLQTVVQNIIENKGKVISETYKTVDKGYGNYQVSILSKYIINAEEKLLDIEINTFTTLFNQYQLENGNWRLDGQINYQKSDLNYTDNQYMSKIKLPNLGFVYYGHQIKDMFNNNLEYYSLILNYVNKVTKLQLNKITVEKLMTAIKDENENYQTNNDIDLTKQIKNENYLYLSIISNESKGTFNLLIKC